MSAEPKHLPGPYRAVGAVYRNGQTGTEAAYWHVAGPDGQPIQLDSRLVGAERAHATALVLAAAPELLAVAEEVERFWDRGGREPGRDLWVRLIRAINAARFPEDRLS